LKPPSYLAGGSKPPLPVFFLLLLLLIVSRCAAETIWIDTDVAIGSPFRDVDDAFALLLAARSPNLTIAGVSATYGNASLRTTTAAARLVLSKMNSRLAVYPGAESPRDRARQTEASEALAATLRQKSTLTYIALGPLTNLAAFQAIHPDLARRIKRVVFIGGTTAETTLRFGSRHPIRIHDANVIKDPAAVAQVLRSKVPITLVPAETAARLTVNATMLHSMRGDPAGDFVQKKSRFWLWFWTKFVGTEGGPIFDAAAILAVEEPDQVPGEAGFATIDSGGNLIFSKSRRPGARAVSFATRISRGAQEFVAERLRSR
jgi:inosine-uridine nucleoside N-ribohydrolase